MSRWIGTRVPRTGRSPEPRSRRDGTMGWMIREIKIETKSDRLLLRNLIDHSD